MNDYTRVKFTVKPNEEFATDILASQLADIGFESFVTEEDGISAYVPQSLFDTGNIDSVIAEFPVPGGKKLRNGSGRRQALR